MRNTKAIVKKIVDGKNVELVRSIDQETLEPTLIVSIDEEKYVLVLEVCRTILEDAPLLLVDMNSKTIEWIKKVGRKI